MTRIESPARQSVHRLIETAHIAAPDTIEGIAADRYVLAVSESLELYDQMQRVLKRVDDALNWGTKEDIPLARVLSGTRKTISRGAHDLRLRLESLGQQELLDRINESVRTGLPPSRLK